MTDTSEPTQSINSCADCAYSEVVVQEGDVYSFLNPHGEEVLRAHQQTVLICRAFPPFVGQWPQVTQEDWCGRWEGK